MQWAEGATGSRGGSFGGPFNFSASPVNIDEDEIGVPRERRETTVIFNQADGKGVNITYNRFGGHVCPLLWSVVSDSSVDFSQRCFLFGACMQFEVRQLSETSECARPSLRSNF